MKANQPKKEKGAKGRKMRAARHNQARQRGAVTHIERHAFEVCTTCRYHARGESEVY